MPNGVLAELTNIAAPSTNLLDDMATVTAAIRKEISHGIILLYRLASTTPPSAEVFLIHQQSNASSHWTFPKGHAEPEDNDDPRLTAFRELKEETGISLQPAMTLEALGACKTVSNDYMYENKRRGVTVHKTNRFFVVWADEAIRNAKWTLQAEEALEAGWYKLEDAEKKVTFDADRNLLRLAIE
ncbi:hypothetical protein HK101_006955 [Irineochytrium annulatum]|nr:hypothetical protein HK101_006955 [Irineochytrium annulatum]